MITSADTRTARLLAERDSLIGMHTPQWQPCVCVVLAVLAVLSQAAHMPAVPVVPGFSPPLPNYHEPLGGLELVPNTANFLIYEASLESGTYRCGGMHPHSPHLDRVPCMLHPHA